MTDEHCAWLGVPKSDGLKAADRASQIGKEERYFSLLGGAALPALRYSGYLRAALAAEVPYGCSSAR